MANTFVKIQTVTVGAGGAASIDFTSIPQTYSDLKIVSSSRHTEAAVSNDVLVTINSSTSNFTAKRVYGSGSSAGSDSNARVVGVTVGASATASVFGNNEVYFSDYTSANYKSYIADIVGENNATTSYQMFVAGLWSNTSPITSITLTANGGNFVQYSTATLYGIKSS
jgi:mannitol-specific phosphotransferase system IIBC component